MFIPLTVYVIGKKIRFSNFYENPMKTNLENLSFLDLSYS